MDIEADWPLLSASWLSLLADGAFRPVSFPVCEPEAASIPPSRFCRACSAISCHFESMSSPPTAALAATFAAVVRILSSSSLFACNALSEKLKIYLLRKDGAEDVQPKTKLLVPLGLLHGFHLYPSHHQQQDYLQAALTNVECQLNLYSDQWNNRIWKCKRACNSLLIGDSKLQEWNAHFIQSLKLFCFSLLFFPLLPSFSIHWHDLLTNIWGDYGFVARLLYIQSLQKCALKK